MNVGFCGLGKLGLPCALAIESKGHHVRGYDPSPAVAKTMSSRQLPYREEGARELLEKSQLQLLPLHDVVMESDIIFVAIQTPHHPQYEGITRIPEDRKDFDYTHLIAGLDEIDRILMLEEVTRTVVVVSTVLPGTMEREIIAGASGFMSLVYNPFFIAMGTTINDFLNPEFVLLGFNEKHPRGHLALDQVTGFYGSIHDRPCIPMPIRDAELTKVAYNTFIGLKIVFANTLMEICAKNGGNVDRITHALSQAQTRLISGRYMHAGMGDGGGCHPRDNIALSWLSDELGLSYNLFDALMIAREKQTEWLAKLIESYRIQPVYVFGTAFKPSTNITTGSPGVLLVNLLTEMNVPTIVHDPYAGPYVHHFVPGLYFIATNHPDFKHFPYPAGSTVLDPWGYVSMYPGVQVIHIGRNQCLQSAPS